MKNPTINFVYFIHDLNEKNLSQIFDLHGNYMTNKSRYDKCIGTSGADKFIEYFTQLSDEEKEIVLRYVNNVYNYKKGREYIICFLDAKNNPVKIEVSGTDIFDADDEDEYEYIYALQEMEDELMQMKLNEEKHINLSRDEYEPAIIKRIK